MAINTKAKRASVAYRTLPPPSGSVIAADRACTAQNYSGIAAGTPVVLDITGRILRLFRFLGRR